jgi:predicted helicase
MNSKKTLIKCKNSFKGCVKYAEKDKEYCSICKGQIFEKEVYKILELKNPVRLIHNTNIDGRQCDIYAVFQESLGKNEYYIECKDHNQGVGKEIVDTFIGAFYSSKITNPKLTKGILISRNKFTSTAREIGSEF